MVEEEGEIELKPKNNEYNEGEEVEIEAIPEDDYEFIEWVGNLEGDKNPTTLTIEENMTIGAEFDKKTVELDISIEGEGELKVEPEKDKYPINDRVDFKAISDEGYQFYRIKGLFSSPSNSSEISNKILRRDKEIEVEFLPSNVTIPGSKLEFDDISLGGGDRRYYITSFLLG